jgi:hypothetical protein
MKKRKLLGLYLAGLSLLFTILACSLFTGKAEPTNTPAPEIILQPTNSPQLAEVTEVVEEPVNTPTEIEREVETPLAKNETVPDGELGVSTITAYRNDYGSLIVTGMVINNTDRAVQNVQIEVQVLDAAGNSLYKEVAYTSLYNLAPWEISPFSLWVWDDVVDPHDYQAEIVGYSATDLERAQVEVRGTMMTFGGGYVNVTGELVNNNTFPIEISDVAAATFDADGQLVTGDTDDISISYLDPGESGPFRISMDAPVDNADSIVDFIVYTDAEVSSGRNTYDIGFISEHDYFDTDGDFHLVGELQNNSDVSLNITLIAGIYDAQENVLDAEKTDVPVYALAPGEHMFYDFTDWYPIDDSEGLYEKMDTYVVQVEPGWTWDTDTQYVDLSFTDDGFEYDSFWGLTFTGQVVNDSGQTITGGIVLVPLRDKQTGELLAMGYQTIYDDIEPGGSQDYEVMVEISEDLDLEGFDYVVIVRGELP